MKVANNGMLNENNNHNKSNEGSIQRYAKEGSNQWHLMKIANDGKFNEKNNHWQIKRHVNEGSNQWHVTRS